MGKLGEKRVKSCKKAIILSLLLSIIFIFTDKTEAYALVNSSYIVIEQSSGRVLKGENIDVRLPMASTTKIATALVVLNNTENLDKEFTIPKEAVGVEGSSIYLVEGEKLTIRELLYGLMMRSGNDSAVALSIATAGSVEAFVGMMNDTVSDLSLKNTHFANPHGLNAEDHYTSAYDLAIISAKAMENETFKEIVGTKNKNISYKDEGERYLQNKNKILWLYEGGNGIKTGFTKAAGRCLVASAKRGDMQVIAVVLNRGDMWNDCINLMDYAFKNYNMVCLYRTEENLVYLPVTGGKADKVLLKPYKAKVYPLTKEEAEKLNIVVDLPENMSAPVEYGVNVGNIKVYCGDCLLFLANFNTMQAVEKKGALDNILDKFKTAG